MKAGIICCCCIIKCMIKEALQLYRARLAACKVGIFWREILQLSKIYNPPLVDLYVSS